MATTLKFSEKFDHPFSNVFIFSKMFPESHIFRCYAGYQEYQRYMFQFIPILLAKEEEIVRPSGRMLSVRL